MMSKIIKFFSLITPPIIKIPIKKLLGPEYSVYKFFNPNWYKNTIGGRWDEIGQLQIDFLKSQGLKPEHYFLDAGCGALRAGRHIAKYLDHGHYYGIDKSREILQAARKIVLPEYKLEHKNPTLMQLDAFEFEKLNQQFDFAIAQSVFTHIDLNSIIQCIMHMNNVLKPGGKFFATFNENKEGKWNLNPIIRPHPDDPNFTTYFDRDVYHYDMGTYKWICEGTDLEVKYIGNWGHPRNLTMVLFEKKS